VPELAALADGRVRLYVCARGIESYLSSDQGASWTREGSVVAPEPGAATLLGVALALFATARARRAA